MIQTFKDKYRKKERNNTIQYILNWRRGFSGTKKHNHNRTEHSTTTVKNPNWPGASKLVIYICSWEVEPRDYPEQIHPVVRTGLEPGIPGISRQSTSTTGPPHCLLIQCPRDSSLLAEVYFSFALARLTSTGKETNSLGRNSLCGACAAVT